MVRKELQIQEVTKGAEGRVLKAKIENLNYVNIYAPVGRHWKTERNTFFKTTIPAFITQNGPTFLLGNLNAVVEDKDRLSYNGKTREAKCKALTGFQLTDVWKKLKPKEAGHTFFHKASSSNIKKVQGMATLPITFSDHLCLQATIRAINTPKIIKRKHYMWKMNTAILEEEDFLIKMRKYISNANGHPLRILNAATWWEEIMKPGIRKITIDHCRQRAQFKKATRLFYEKCLEEVLAEIPDGPGHLEQYQELQLQIRQWEEEQLKGAAIRSRAFGDPKDETPSIYHKTREKILQERSKILQLQAVDGNLLSEDNEISKENYNHFQNQFTKSSENRCCENHTFLSEVKTCPRLNPQVYQELDNKITISELKTALEKS